MLWSITLRCAVISVSISFAMVLITAALSEVDSKPNFILIVADDLGYGDLGSYGQMDIETPVLDQLAQDGIKFTEFYSGSTVCRPSRCTLMSGLHSGRCPLRGNFPLTDLPPSTVTLAERLKSGGYMTGAIGKWALGEEGTSSIPTKSGFDSFYGYLNQTHAHNYYPEFLIRNADRESPANVVPNAGPFGEGVATVRVQYSHDLFIQEALDFIDRFKGDDFFLYLPLTIPHANNEGGINGMEVPDLGIYANRDWPESQKGIAAMITRMDGDIGRIIARLQAHGIDEKTLIIFTSDNGPHA